METRNCISRIYEVLSNSEKTIEELFQKMNEEESVGMDDIRRQVNQAVEMGILEIKEKIGIKINVMATSPEDTVPAIEDDDPGPSDANRRRGRGGAQMRSRSRGRGGAQMRSRSRGRRRAASRSPSRPRSRSRSGPPSRQRSRYQSRSRSRPRSRSRASSGRRR